MNIFASLIRCVSFIEVSGGRGGCSKVGIHLHEKEYCVKSNQDFEIFATKSCWCEIRFED